jgi:hypothetical protein
MDIVVPLLLRYLTLNPVNYASGDGIELFYNPPTAFLGSSSILLKTVTTVVLYYPVVFVKD